MLDVSLGVERGGLNQETETEGGNVVGVHWEDE